MHATTSTIIYIYNGFEHKGVCCESSMLFNNLQKDKPDPKPLVVKGVPSI